MKKEFFKKTTRKKFIGQIRSDNTLTLITTVTRRCVLGCLYCYARDPQKRETEKIVGDDILEKIMHDAFDVRQKTILFEFTGGEALVGGIPLFEKIIKYQKKYERNGKIYSNCIQTSGAIYDEQLYNFLIDNKFRLSLTIDGPKDLHDLQRPTRCGKGSFDTVIKSYQYIKKQQGWCGVLCTITKNSLNRAGEILALYKELGVGGCFTNPYIFDPSKAVNQDTIALTNDEFAGYFTDQFENILNVDDPNLHPNFIVSNMKMLCGLNSGIKCGQSGRCISNLVNVDNNGDVFICCKFLGNEGTAYGNIMKKPLCSLLSLRNSAMRRVIDDRVKAVNRCEEKGCIYLPLCNSGCPYNSYLASGHKNLSETDYLCKGKYRMFSYIDERLKEFGVKTITDVFKDIKKGGNYVNKESGFVCGKDSGHPERENAYGCREDAGHNRAPC